MLPQAFRRPLALTVALLAVGQTLKLPPGKKVGPLRNVRESIAYLQNPDGFVANRFQEFGPVFSTFLFFRPTVVVGGPQAVTEFIEKERTISVSSLPDTFSTLHTEYGLLNLAGESLTATRRAILPLLNAKSLDDYLPVIERRVSEWVEDVAARGETQLTPDLQHSMLSLFAEIFTGSSLSEKEAQDFVSYNAGLLGLGTFDPTFKKGVKALEALKQSMAQRLADARANPGWATDPRFSVFRQMESSTDETGATWSNDRIHTASVLMVWGAYAEVVSLVADAVIELGSRPECVARIREEAVAAGAGPGQPFNSNAWSAAQLPFTQGCLRETLRLVPPAGGGFRMTTTPVTIGGFDIPEGWVVTADPRIGSQMEELYPSPKEFKPERWIEAAADEDVTATSARCPVTGTATNLPASGFFPGGIGMHQCPGVPLAELCGRVAAVRWVQQFDQWGSDAPVKRVLIPISMPVAKYVLKVTSRVA